MDKVNFDKHGWDSFSDVIAEIMCDIDPPSTAKYYTSDALHQLFCLLPRNIRFTAYEWGMSDSVFRDNACVWLHANWEKVENSLIL